MFILVNKSNRESIGPFQSSEDAINYSLTLASNPSTYIVTPVIPIPDVEATMWLYGYHWVFKSSWQKLSSEPIYLERSKVGKLIKTKQKNNREVEIYLPIDQQPDNELTIKACGILTPTTLITPPAHIYDQEPSQEYWKFYLVYNYEAVECHKNKPKLVKAQKSEYRTTPQGIKYCVTSNSNNKVNFQLLLSPQSFKPNDTSRALRLAIENLSQFNFA
jgi:hypothetical protein